MKYTEINSKAWDSIVSEGCEWTRPISHEDYERNINGKLELFLTPSKPIPENWWPSNIKDLKILCLACGGGQQAPILAGRGAQCICFDNSIKQLEQDQLVMLRENLNYETLKGDMTEKFPFKDNYFDIVVYAFSNVYIEDVQHVWDECYRVLKPEGSLFSGLDNGINFLFKDQSKLPLVVENKLPFNSIKSQERLEGYNGYNPNELIRFSHTIEEQIGGQLKAGFQLIDLFEDKDTDTTPGFLIKNYIPQYITTWSMKK